MPAPRPRPISDFLPRFQNVAQTSQYLVKHFKQKKIKGNIILVLSTYGLVGPDLNIYKNLMAKMDKNNSQYNSSEKEHSIHMYRLMLKIRKFEENVNQLYTSAKMPGLSHLSIGQEAVAVGVCEALRNDDYITSTHRGHGHCLAKGAATNLMFAELLGKASGYCRASLKLHDASQSFTEASEYFAELR